MLSKREGWCDQVKPMSVEQIGKRIFGGVMILSFHINIGRITLLPAWIGWYLIANGIERMKNMTQNEAAARPLSRARVLGLIMLCINLVEEFTVLFTNGIGDKAVILYPLSTAIELSIFYFLLTGISLMDDTKPRSHYSVRIASYCVLFTAMNLGVWFQLYLWNDAFLILCFAFVLLILRLWLAGVVRSFCTAYPSENQGDSVV